MAKFYVDDRSPIVAELIRQDFDFEESEALRLIDMDETASNTDGTFALGTGAACIAATAGTLALSGLTLPILLPAIGIGLSSVSYWNSKVAARSREMETQFLSDHPEVLAKVQGKLRAGESRETIAAAFEQCLRAYRWGDVKQMERVLGNSPATATAETTAQSCIQNPEAQDATRTESAALAQTELQPIANKTYICVQSVGTIPDHTQAGMPRELAEKLALDQGFVWSDLKKQDEKEQKNGLPWFNFLFENKSCYPGDFWCRLYEQPIVPDVAAAPSMQHIVSPVWNPAQDLGENPQSALIVGVPGAGKGVMVSNAIRVLKAKVPNLKVFVIDPKASPKERGYWESIADEYRAFSLKNCEDPDEGAAWLLSCMEDFRRLPGPKLCIFDELMTAATELELSDSKMKALPKLKKFVVGLVGQGDSEAEWLWAMTQSPQVKDLGMSGGVRANLRVIGLVSPKNMTAVEALVSTQLIPKPDGGMDELRSIMAASPVGRAVFDGKIARWLPMPTLENHSGFDRDNRSLADEGPELRSSVMAIAQPSLNPDDEWDGIPEVESDGPDSDQWDLIERFSEETGQGYFNNPNFDLWLKKQTYSNGKPIRVSADNAPGKALSGQTIEVETTEVDDTPAGLEAFPLVLTIWQYLDGKDSRSFSQINDAMRAKGKIPKDALMAKVPHSESYRDALKSVVAFGVVKGFLAQVSEDNYEAIRKH